MHAIAEPFALATQMPQSAECHCALAQHVRAWKRTKFISAGGCIDILLKHLVFRMLALTHLYARMLICPLCDVAAWLQHERWSRICGHHFCSMCINLNQAPTAWTDPAPALHSVNT